MVASTDPGNFLEEPSFINVEAVGGSFVTLPFITIVKDIVGGSLQVLVGKMVAEVAATATVKQSVVVVKLA